MSLINSMNIAGTAMVADSIYMNTISSNLANANTVATSKDTAYRAKNPVFSSLLNDAMFGKGGAGVRVTDIAESNAEIRSMYNPDHPAADEKGYIYMSNVNLIEQMTNMIAASRNYQNNVEVAKTAKGLLQQTLSMGQ